MKIKREDKRMRCLKCYHEFWADRYISNKLIWCPRCNNLETEIVKEYGKPVYEINEYEYYNNEKIEQEFYER